MQYLEFQKAFSDFTVFSLADIRQAEPGFHRRRLNEWQEKGYIKKVIKGYYIFSGPAIKEYFLSFNEYPWFKDANISSMTNVKLIHNHHLYWPKLDIDLSLEILANPEKYPLTYM